jgi:hypothetical protein
MLGITISLNILLMFFTRKEKSNWIFFEGEFIISIYRQSRNPLPCYCSSSRLMKGATTSKWKNDLLVRIVWVYIFVTTHVLSTSYIPFFLHQNATNKRMKGNFWEFFCSTTTCNGGVDLFFSHFSHFHFEKRFPRYECI